MLSTERFLHDCEIILLKSHAGDFYNADNIV